MASTVLGHLAILTIFVSSRCIEPLEYLMAILWSYLKPMALFFGRWPADTKDWHQFQNLCGRCWTCGNLDELHTVGDTIGVCLDELFHHGHGEGLNPSGLRLANCHRYIHQQKLAIFFRSDAVEKTSVPVGIRHLVYDLMYVYSGIFTAATGEPSQQQ